MDPSHFIQYSLYSKLITEGTKLLSDIEFTPHIVYTIIFCIMIRQFIPINFYYTIEDYMIKLCTNSNECYIIVPYHTKHYSIGITTKMPKTIYSERFLALNHYVKKNKTNIFSLTEIMNFENIHYWDDQSSEYILLPNQSQRIKICNKRDIYFEIIVEEDKSENDKKEKESSATVRLPSKNYIFKILKSGKENIEILNTFLEECIDAYKKEITDIKEQMTYEFIKSYIDENDNVKMSFQSTIFKSNKTFDNLFFDGKEEILEDIREFSKKTDIIEKAKIIQHYKRIGKPYKRTYLLHGPPGTGKSSLIKAFINETGRHCVLVQWSRIKTSDDFCRLCRQLKIESNKIPQSEIILVFEDFDANKCSAVKIRENLKVKKEIEKPTDSEVQTDISHNVIKDTLASVLSASKMDFKIEKEDELTLECILNTIDGIRELYDTVIVFTTNDIASIDPALIRPGRVDKVIKMDMASPTIIKQIVEHYYDVYETDEIKLLENITTQISPAKVQELCEKNKESMSNCIREILSI
jgi:ATP-dependent 26S proteasome regulatory subunit